MNIEQKEMVFNTPGTKILRKMLPGWEQDTVLFERNGVKLVLKQRIWGWLDTLNFTTAFWVVVQDCYGEKVQATSDFNQAIKWFGEEIDKNIFVSLDKNQSV